MTYQEAHQAIQTYFLNHYSVLSPDERVAFLICLLSLPLVPIYAQNMTPRLSDEILEGGGL